MRCRTASQLMSLQMDGMLDPRQAAELERHLQACPRCRATWASWQRLNAVMAQKAWAEPSAGIPARVLARLPESRRAAVVPAATPVWVRAGAVVLATMAVLLIVLAGTVAFLGWGPQPAEWAFLIQGGRGLIAAAWESLSQVAEALGVVAEACWRALRWPWLPLLGSAAVLAAVLIWFGWQWGKRPIRRG